MTQTIQISDDVRRDAQAGRLSKQTLADLLAPDQRRAFLAACNAIDKSFTEACTATHDPCLESGCALEGETCLQPLLRAEGEVQAAYGAAWTRFV
jgi:hypothetical protein